MDAKTLRLYDILIAISESDFLIRKNAAAAFAESLLSIGYEYGIDACHYLFLRQEKIFGYESVRDGVTVGFLDKLVSLNRARTVKEIISSPVLQKGFYTLNGHAFEGETLDIAVNLLLSNKFEDAGNLLFAAQKNSFISFGAGMKALFEEYTKRLLEKQGESKKPQISKKAAGFLMGYIEKIKGPEKPLLTQRIKELL